MFAIETIPAQRIASHRRTGEYGAKNHEQMNAFKVWATQSGTFREDSVLYGITWDDPIRTAPEQCRYDTALTLSPEDSTEEAGGGDAVGSIKFEGFPVEERTLPSGPYAVFELAHTAEALVLAWQESFATLAEAGLAFDASRPAMERYAPKLLAQHRCELLLPILTN